MNNKGRQEEAIFEAARQIGDPRQRQIYLQAACAGDPALRDRLEDMLAAQPDADGYFEEGVVSLELPASTMTLPTEKPGDRIGRYKLLQKIGEGGCGVVYMAEQEEPVRRRVALKVIKLGMDTRNVVARFQAERQALALMDHPNIAKVLDAGATETGRPFFVMELVRGIKITDYCDENGLATRERLQLFIRVCQAIQHAHQKGIIHRDLKPSNILVTVNDGVPVPKVIDFGIAKATEGRLTDQTLFTAFEQFLGTPAYMSPEQAVLTSLDIDTRSDIYSLGVLLYELLTGKTPFDAKELLRAGLDEMRQTIREREPPRPSTRLSTMVQGELVSTAQRRQTDAPKLVHLVRGDLDWIVMRCLEKDRTRRYEAANGLAADIQRHLSNEPVVACPPSAVYRFRKLVRRNKRAVIAVGLTTALLVVGTVVSSWLAVRQNRLRLDAQSAQATARQHLYAAHMNLAQQAWESGNTRVAVGLVERYETPGSEDLRGFEWWYLKRLFKGNWRLKLQVNYDHTDWPVSAVFSPNGRTLAIAGAPAVQLWDTTVHAFLAPLEGHQSRVKALAFSPQGELLASEDRGGAIILWDFEKKTRLTTFPPGNEGEHTLAFFPDGKTLAASRGQSVRVWDMAQRRELPDLVENGSKIACLGISPDGKLLATGDINGTVNLWDVEAKRNMGSLPGHFGRVICVAFSPDGETLVSTSFGNEVKLWNVKTRALVRTVYHSSAVESVSFSPNGQFLATGSEDHTARLWEVATLQPVKSFLGHTDAVESVAFSPDGQTLATESPDQTVRLWDTTMQDRNVLQHEAAVSALAFSPDGQSLAAGCVNGALKLWNVADQREIAQFSSTNWVWAIAFSPDGSLLASSGGVWYRGDVPAEIKLWDTTHGQEIGSLPGHKGCVYSVSFSPDGKTLISGGRDQTVRLWEVETRRELHKIASVSANDGWLAPVSTNGDWSHFCELAPNGKTLVSAGSRNPICLWKIPSGEKVKTLQSEAGVTCAAFTRDGWTLAIGTGDGIQLWDMAHLEQQPFVLTPESQVLSLAFAKDGHTLAAGGKDGTVTLWNVMIGQAVLTLHQHSRPVTKVAFSPDGNLLASAGVDKTVRLWRAADPH